MNYGITEVVDDFAETSIGSFIPSHYSTDSFELQSNRVSPRLVHGVAFVAAIAVPTLLNPFIPVSVRTIVQQHIIDHGRSVTQQNAQTQTVDFVSGWRGFFNFVNPAEIERYLSDNQELTPVFIEVVEAIQARRLNMSTLALELYQDTEEDWEKIFITLEPDIRDIDELLEIEEELFQSTIGRHEPSLNGRIVLMVC